MNVPRTISFAVLVALVVGGIIYLNSQKAPRTTIGEKVEIKTTVNKEDKTKRYPVAKEITTPDGFINTDGKPITIGEFVGKKVVLLDIWTYSCINCQRTTPYLNAWYEKYKDKGLVVLGLHTPEFEFEKNYQNVFEATKRMGIKYPVILDNDFSTWNAYQNRFWPRKYLIDIDGFIVYDHIGEGAYDETERKIQELLTERMTALGMAEEIDTQISKPAGVEEIDVSVARSPEIYFGAARNLYLGNGKSETVGVQSLKEPAGIKTNILYLDGEWNFNAEFAENINAGAKIIFRYSAAKVFFVASSAKGINVRILRDGVPVEREAGSDAREGSLFIFEERLYRLIEDPEGHGEHTLEIIIEEPGLQAFTFTFG